MKVSALVLVALLLLAGCDGTGNGIAEEQVVKIGIITPLTGEAAWLTDDTRVSYDLAVERFNEEHELQLELVYEDGKCNGKDAAIAAQKLINVDKVKQIITGCSGETLGAAPFAEAAEVIIFSSGSGSPEVTNAGDFVFRNFPSDASSGSKVAKAALAKGHERIGILVELTDYGQALADVFSETYTAEGGTIVAKESFNPGTSDFKSILTKIQSKEPDALYIITSSINDFLIIIRQKDEQGLRDIPLYANEVTAAEEVKNEYAAQVEGAIYAEPAFDEENSAVKQLIAEIEKEKGENIALPPIYIATAYDAISILGDAILSCGSTETRCQQEYLYAIKDRQGYAGALTIDEHGDPVLEYILMKMENGENIPA
jgi:branched-chain amino acid transport system substrate-binding protein